MLRLYEEEGESFYNTSMTKQADLSEYVFDGQVRNSPSTFSGMLLQWMEGSSRFTAFVETYRDKIRKKVRLAREPESLLDLRSELEVAYWLLNDRRLEVAYEPYASAKKRSPDYAVTYRANLVFNIEVARLRGEGNGGEAERRAEPGRIEERILRIFLYKLGQMQAGMPNLLLIDTRQEVGRAVDLGKLLQDVKTRVDRKDAAFFAAARYAGPAVFYKDFLHLTGILLWGAEGQLWVNKQARPGLEEKVLRLVSSLMGGGGDGV